MNMVTEATFNELEEAEPLRRRLELAGIPASIQDERRLQKYWFMAEPMGGVHLRVETGHDKRARQLLEEWDAADGALRNAIRCPACRSPRIEFPQFTRRFVTPTIYALLCALHLFERRFYCQTCHYTWPLALKVSPPTDVLGWPVKPKSSATDGRAAPSSGSRH
jgi:hypothetical protein